MHTTRHVGHTITLPLVQSAAHSAELKGGPLCDHDYCVNYYT